MYHTFDAPRPKSDECITVLTTRAQNLRMYHTFDAPRPKSDECITVLDVCVCVVLCVVRCDNTCLGSRFMIILALAPDSFIRDSWIVLLHLRVVQHSLLANSLPFMTWAVG